jgi:thiosulfate/3-mercaptopyruvate sulfurtransferase
LRYNVSSMTTLKLPAPLVSASWLAAHLEHSELVLLDATFHPVAAVVPSETTGLRLPGARAFDFDERICDPDTSLPHMMPSAELFTREVRALGIGRSSKIVVYDRLGVFSSPRAWWMFKAMGHEQISVLDGGLPAWVAAGLPTESGAAAARPPGDFVAKPRPELFCDAEQVSAALADPRSLVLDARSQGRFAGREPEPRAGLRGGHMPNALNLPSSTVQHQGRMRAAEELETLFAAKVQDREQLVLSCGSGVTACVLALAATLAGYSQLRVYDGSWSEWGLPSSRPVVTGD